jgi:hypothetical protein
MDRIMKNGAHKARAPATNDTQVKAPEDNMKLLLEKKQQTQNEGHSTGIPLLKCSRSLCGHTADEMLTSFYGRYLN